MTWGESRWWRDSRIAGAAYCAGGVGLAGLASLLVEAIATTSGRPGRSGALTLAAYTAIASRSLCDTASTVADQLDAGDLSGARQSLRGLVGRRTESLDSQEIARAVVESVAENTVDAVIAPMVWGFVGGAPGVLVYRAINTMDAMVGHHRERYEHFGWASARLDDLANWFPARCTAALAAACSPTRALRIFDAVQRQAPAHPSPNAGVAEAAFAASLGVRLGGVSDYDGRIETRPPLGVGRPPEPADIASACRLSRRIATAASVVTVLAAVTASRRCKEER
jgi:adenosylcobinamide-phosphate synthase